MRLARRLRQMRDDSVDLNPNQLSAMAVLLNSGDQLMGELAEEERVRPPSMTRAATSHAVPIPATTGNAWCPSLKPAAR